MALEGKKVLVVGTGKSGIAATQLLLKNNVKTVLFDGNNELINNKKLNIKINIKNIIPYLAIFFIFLFSFYYIFLFIYS